MDIKPGDKIMVKIGHRNIETYIDEHGTQRITPVNKLYEWLYDHGKLDLNEIASGYFCGNISFKDYFELYLSIRYSMSGFYELHNFEHLTIKNPLWEKQDET